MKDRVLLLGGSAAVLVGVVALLAAAGVWRTLPVPGISKPVPLATVVPPQQTESTGKVDEFQLTVSRISWEIAPGRTVQAYAYNGQIPGPELRVTEGDTVKVAVTNQLQEATTVHWHGVDVPSSMDGVPDLSQSPIPAGGTFTYQFVATPAGTKWYHSHFDEVNQQGDGLYGPLIIEPRQQIQTQPDREFTLITSQWQNGAASGRLAVPTPSASSGMGGMLSPNSAVPVFNTFTLNGKMAPAIPPLIVHQGERVHLRLINAGATDTIAYGLAGHQLTITNSDGNPLAQPEVADGVSLGVGERADVEFVADNPGRWTFVALSTQSNDGGPGPTANRGVVGEEVIYAGHENDPLQDFPADANLHVARYTEFSGPPHPDPPTRTYDLTLSGGSMMGMGSETSWTINGKSYPGTDPLNVHQGDRVRIHVSNMSMEDHPMHLHGHTFQVVGISGRAVDGPIKDTLTVHPMEQYDLEFVADNPGTWLFHCHNLVHMSGGLMTEIHYQ